MASASEWFVSTCNAAENTDYALSPLSSRASVERVGRVRPEYKFMFSPSARWPGTMRWRYNHENAPAPYTADKQAAIREIIAASQKWTAACGIQIVYDGETSATPRVSGSDSPDGTSVVGWQPLRTGNFGYEYSWYLDRGTSERTLVESDIALDPMFVTSTDRMTRTMAHEWGHALGLAHSNVADALMSGPPDSLYNELADPTPDDLRGCRCLYGPPSGQRTGYACTIPDRIDFGTITAGAAAEPRQVTVSNDGNAPLVVVGIRTGGGEYGIDASRCPPGSTLDPGASCSFAVLARPAISGLREDIVTLDTSDGPYRIPVQATGAAAISGNFNFQGLWENAPAGSESGWGMDLAHQGDIILATWFTYDGTGRPWWLTMTAVKSGENVYAGTLYETRGPPFGAVPFDASAVAYAAVGSGTLKFRDANSATFSYVVNGISQEKTLTRTVFGPAPVCAFAANPNPELATNYQDAWWAGADESGWGVNIAHQGDVIFAAWFTYDAAGRPNWLSATARKTAAGRFEGDLYRTTGPAFHAMPFDPLAVVRTRVGALALDFTDGNHATFAYSVALGPSATTVTQSKQLTRLVFRSPGTVCQ